jgi:hypothetical protein
VIGDECRVVRKAARILKDYVVDLYYPVDGLAWRNRMSSIPRLALIEYLVYRVDSVAERSKDIDLDVTRDGDYVTLHKYKAKFEALLRRLNAYNSVVAHEMDMGEQYVRLENKVTSQGTATHADVLRLAELRPSDVRLLHGMIFAMLGRPADQVVLDLLWPVEVLADIGNDLEHYKADVAAGQFNTYRAFVRLYGTSAPDRIRLEIARYEDSSAGRRHPGTRGGTARSRRGA